MVVLAKIFVNTCIGNLPQIGQHLVLANLKARRPHDLLGRCGGVDETGAVLGGLGAAVLALGLLFAQGSGPGALHLVADRLDLGDRGIHLGLLLGQQLVGCGCISFQHPHALLELRDLQLHELDGVGVSGLAHRVELILLLAQVLLCSGELQCCRCRHVLDRLELGALVRNLAIDCRELVSEHPLELDTPSLGSGELALARVARLLDPRGRVRELHAFAVDAAATVAIGCGADLHHRLLVRHFQTHAGDRELRRALGAERERLPVLDDGPHLLPSSAVGRLAQARLGRVHGAAREHGLLVRAAEADTVIAFHERIVDCLDGVQPTGAADERRGRGRGGHGDGLGDVLARALAGPGRARRLLRLGRGRRGRLHRARARDLHHLAQRLAEGELGQLVAQLFLRLGEAGRAHGPGAVAALVDDAHHLVAVVVASAAVAVVDEAAVGQLLLAVLGVVVVVQHRGRERGRVLLLGGAVLVGGAGGAVRRLGVREGHAALRVHPHERRAAVGHDLCRTVRADDGAGGVLILHHLLEGGSAIGVVLEPVDLQDTRVEPEPVHLLDRLLAAEALAGDGRVPGGLGAHGLLLHGVSSIRQKPDQRMFFSRCSSTRRARQNALKYQKIRVLSSIWLKNSKKLSFYRLAVPRSSISSRFTESRFETPSSPMLTP